MADDAKHDENFVTTMQGVSSVDGTSPTDIHLNPATGALLLET